MSKSPSFRWALSCVVAIILGGNMGAAIYFAEDILNLNSFQSLLAGALVLFVFVAIYSLVRMYLSLADDPALSPGERERYRRNILLVGPVAALELLANLWSSDASHDR